jgi:hypothetical protein
MPVVTGKSKKKQLLKYRYYCFFESFDLNPLLIISFFSTAGEINTVQNRGIKARAIYWENLDL